MLCYGNPLGGVQCSEERPGTAESRGRSILLSNNETKRSPDHPHAVSHCLDFSFVRPAFRQGSLLIDQTLARPRLGADIESNRNGCVGRPLDVLR
jgi:hypothetical protein